VNSHSANSPSVARHLAVRLIRELGAHLEAQAMRDSSVTANMVPACPRPQVSLHEEGTQEARDVVDPVDEYADISQRALDGTKMKSFTRARREVLLSSASSSRLVDPVEVWGVALLSSASGAAFLRN
jgi:hypothetical protein